MPSDRIGAILATLVTALLVFWLAYDDATFGLVARSSLAIAVWWAIALGVAAGLLQLPSRRSFWGVAGLLAAFAAWTGASIAWATSDERAFNELNRVTLYIGVFALAALVGRFAAPGRLADGFALGIVGVGVLSLAQRFFPDAISPGEYDRYLTGPQLKYPVEYVNGLGILLALSLPLLLRSATSSQSLLASGAALAPVPALATAIYLTSSRGAVIVAATGVAVFIALTHRRWATAGAVAVGVLGSAGAVWIITRRSALVDEPLSRAAEEQGAGAALLIALVCAGTGIAYGAASRILRGWAPPRAVGWATVAATGALLATGIAAADPIEKFDTFRKPPTEAGALDPEYTVRGHLLSTNSTGRWQFWRASGQQFEEHPLAGEGAGSYEAWWAQHGSFAMFITDAHSLYFETLGELGVVGLVLLVAAFALGIGGATARVRRTAEPLRGAYAALTACFAAYAIGAGLDWMWEFTVVSVVGLAALGLALGDDPHESSCSRRLWLRVGLPLLAVSVIAAQAIPLLARTEIRESQAAAGRGDLGGALVRATTATDIQPWAASPHLQRALVLEEAGRLPPARRSIRDAIERDRTDWRLWLVQARLETKAGSIGPARRSIRRAAALNPRSPLFAGD